MRPVRRSRRRRTTVVAGAASVLLVVAGVVALGLSRHDDGAPDARRARVAPAHVHGPTTFPETVGSQRLIAEATSRAGAGSTMSVDIGRTPVDFRFFCRTQDGPQELQLMISINGDDSSFGSCGRQKQPVELAALPGIRLLTAGHYSIAIRTADPDARTRVLARTSFGIAAYDASDRVEIAGASLDRAVELDGRAWSLDTDPVEPGSFTPDTDVYLRVLGGRDGYITRLAIVTPDGRDIGRTWRELPDPVRLRAGTSYRLVVQDKKPPTVRIRKGEAVVSIAAGPPDPYSEVPTDHRDHIVVYRPVD